MPRDRDGWMAKMEKAQVLHPPLAPPAACRRCLSPLPTDKRHWDTCYPCGREHPRTLTQISAVTYGASETVPWTFFKMAKFEEAAAEKVAIYVTAIAAMLSRAIEADHADFSDGDADHVVVRVPSSHGLIDRCLATIAAEGWPSLRVLDALTAEDRPKQTDLDKAGRRKAAAGKYICSDEVEDKHVLLLDDAYTTGYTIHDAARAASAAGAVSVSCVVYARRIYPEAMAVYRAELGEDDGDEG